MATVQKSNHKLIFVYIESKGINWKLVHLINEAGGSLLLGLIFEEAAIVDVFYVYNQMWIIILTTYGMNTTLKNKTWTDNVVWKQKQNGKKRCWQFAS